LQEKLDKAENERDKLIKELSEIKSNITAYATEIQTLERQHRETELDLLSSENKISVFDGNIKDLVEGENKRQRELENIQSEQSSAENMIAKLSSEIDAGNQQIKELENEIERQISQLDQSKSRVEEGNESITKARIDVTACESEKTNVDALVGRINLAIKEISDDVQVRQLSLEKLREDRELLVSAGTGGVSVKEKEEARAYFRKLI